MREYLKARRKEKGLKQSDVAASMGISRNYYNYIEAGKRQSRMDYETMEKLSKALSLPVKQIVESEKAYIESLYQNILA